MQYRQPFDYDFVIIGSGFGGSVSALRLSEKGYRVLVLEKGKRLHENDFPKTNWQLKRWLWMPALRFFGLFKMTFFRHVTVLSGVGVGGGSLVYANTLPVPKRDFFTAPSWSHLADWEQELAACYDVALRMLGAAPNPRMHTGDLALQQVAHEINREEHFHPTTVSVFFGEPGVTVEDPYFGGRGPQRTGCVFCGGCMLGCRFGAKNTLDRNYLYLAEQLGARIQAESEVDDVTPLGAADGSDGYRIHWRASTGFLKKARGSVTARSVVFAGGVLGTIPLLLDLKQSSLPNLSDRVGADVRTNSEALVGVTAYDDETVCSDGIAISAIVNTDEHSHTEVVRYPAGAGFWRLLMAPMVQGGSALARILNGVKDVIGHPREYARIYFVRDWAKHTQILLFMQTINSTLRFSKGRLGMRSTLDTGTPPSAFIPAAQDISHRFGRAINGKPMVLATETLFGIPTTAHILGGAVMGSGPEQGVIDKDNRVFGYQNMYICDGSMISANPGVNPSLTITALSERAMSKIPAKTSAEV